ncbi:hypothetical protein [Rhodopirellula sp. P2]|uniref:hypothetical protein n=1 Tax=Rhodopirellula sp. P2 TaxID=2127060 RepID=UPI002367DF3E|nr:hypothetical protein [Rhodopirellula sp. P2]WDQ18903.1 hypothetical protein PSR62_10245 [Rhodopirellula sp. P2]
MRATASLEELLDHFAFNRFNCPYVFVVVRDHLDERPPGGPPINGGVNNGGGVIQLGRQKLTEDRRFQSPLRHELGHGFGLVHPNLYGESLSDSDSVMSYNESHFTNRFREALRIPRLSCEDIRALVANDRVFQDLNATAVEELCGNIGNRKKLKTLPPMRKLGGMGYEVRVTADVNSEYETQASNVVLTSILPDFASDTPDEIWFDSNSMWQSTQVSNGWITLNIEFPLPTPLDQINIYSRHSGEYHAVTSAHVLRNSGASYEQVCSESNLKPTQS